MHPALSIIVFTTASGAGYGLLLIVSALALAGAPPQGRAVGLAATLLATALIVIGLGASTLHLGHPERAWRAFSQWRTSWLSREGVLAVASFVPVGIFLLEYLTGRADAPSCVPALAMVALGGATVFCTAMIYASLKPIPAWHNRRVPCNYLMLALLSGALLLHALHRVGGSADPTIAFVTLCLAVLAGLAKWAYWRHIDTSPDASTRESATGLGHLGRVRSLDPPHTQDNFVQKEMIFRIARRHAHRLRRIALAAAFVVPGVLTALALAVGGYASMVCAVVAAVSGLFGVVVERWLFFAEARHVVTLYY